MKVAKESVKKINQLKIVEGIAGVWHFHLSESGLSGHPAICGNKRVMSTYFRFDIWNTPNEKDSPIKYTYCKDCDDLRKQVYVSPQ